MAGSVARVLTLALPMALVGALTLYIPVAQQQSATLCAVPVGDSQDDGRLDAAQVSNARIVVSVAAQLRLPTRAAIVAVAPRCRSPACATCLAVTGTAPGFSSSVRPRTGAATRR